MPAGPTSLRLLDEPATPPARNMALDEALLLAGDDAALRLYGWAPHAVSLGYFQRIADFADLEASVPKVRRLTGGGAIWHGDELTFALAAPAALLPRDLDAGYALLHDAVAAALGEIGVAVTRLTVGAAPGPRPHARWCFEVPGRHDLVDDRGRKLVGSAQRRVRTAAGPRVLHHGSIVLRRPAATPFVAAIADRVDPASVAAPLRRALARTIAAAVGISLGHGAWTAAEATLARTLQRDRYDAPAFLAVR
ncbi:MAG: biotin/lipoate A/B protein ligase family protein [Planctomycetota bacterium]